MLRTTKYLYLSAGAVILSLVYFLSSVFSGRLILPQTFSVGFVTIHYYGIILAIAVFCSYYLAIKSTSKYDISVKQGGDIIFWIIIGGFIGARVYHVLSAVGYYYLHPADIVKIWQGGLSIYGAVLGGLVALWLCKKLLVINLKLSVILNWLTPSLILGQIIGRLGNLFNYEVYGYPTQLPWKMFVPREFRLSTYWDTSFYHPWFLYEQLGLILIWCVLKFGLKGQKSNLFISYVLLYNLMRFSLEFLRIDSNFIGQFRQNALVSLFLVLTVLGIMLYKQGKKHTV
jgi:phosphatidylglycerol:prolipoprotein diacylglycerol transferase